MRPSNLNALLAFRRVVELGSFNAAARNLGMTGGAISKLVAQLEADLGARLLHRTTRTLSVTEEGVRYHASAVRALDELADAAEAARSRPGEPSGTLTASVPTSFALVWLARRLPALLERHPKLRLDLQLNDRTVDLVEEGFDCALRIASQLASSSLVARRLGGSERLLVAAPAYLAKAPALREPGDLQDHDCLVYTLSGREWPLGGKLVEVSGRLRTNNSVMLRDALVAGRGVALAPDFVVADLLRSGALVEVLPAYRAPPMSIYGVLPHQRHVAPKVRAFLDFVESELAAAPAQGAPSSTRISRSAAPSRARRASP